MIPVKTDLLRGASTIASRSWQLSPLTGLNKRSFQVAYARKDCPSSARLLDFPAARFVLEIDPGTSLCIKDRPDCRVFKNQDFTDQLRNSTNLRSKVIRGTFRDSASESFIVLDRADGS